VLAEGLWYEWKSAGVDVIACCAGATTTPNYLNTNPGRASWLEPRPQSAEQVVEECLRRIGTVPSFVSGRGNRWVSFLMQHLFSRKKAIITMGDGMKKMYRL
jgi:NAD(P)-dependent dehydrogenase (short-subunit alcohol dehydrogenase family)